ncbi:MAG TPA: hypothetical protein VFB45_19295 [Pseudolabrys sp.]|nr:hypothetical protein [Pseudolabrys sp.]
MARKRKAAIRPAAENEGPDDLRRTDQRPTRPEFLAEDDSAPLAVDDLSPDGGNPQHPTHDEPIEDLMPEDYEALADDARRAKLDGIDEEEIFDPEHEAVSSKGTGDPLDNRGREPGPFDRGRKK